MFQLSCFSEFENIHHPIGISHATKRPPYDNYKQERFGLRCGRARATQNHILWECLPPPPNTQNGQIPEEIDKKITSEKYETQRDIVRRVLELLDLQKPGTTDRSQDVS
ncbi:hypothetical protein HPB52_020975 [Rhipicephalus sanguineus]|uniref:Uncharacterized protein n=1 Tax=Rhipicephalus sanguineus TaxID=34632 RepID=A0A9D4Q2V3_RHISA|nr:hypothetical protein HPB52_020975 [Rhipicephalus sanguineus]